MSIIIAFVVYLWWYIHVHVYSVYDEVYINMTQKAHVNVCTLGTCACLCSVHWVCEATFGCGAKKQTTLKQLPPKACIIVPL